MKSQKQAVALIAFLLTFACTSLFAAVPSTISFQARVTDSAGNAINDTVDVTLKIYNDPFTPTEEWSELHPAVPIQTELVQLELSSVSPFPVGLFDNDELWLGITLGTDPEMTPRIRLLAVPYAIVASGVSGDIKTDIAELQIIGRPSNPPELYIEDDASVTPTVEEYIRITDLSVSIVVDRGASDVDWSVLEADRLTIWHEDGPIGSKMDQRSLELTSPDVLLPIPLPPPPDPDPYLLIADDIAGQIFASMTQSGRLQTYFEGGGGTISDLLPDELSFSTNNGATLGCRVGFTGLEVHGGSVQLLDGTDLTVTGTLDLTGGTLDLSGSSLAVGGDLDVNGGLTVGGDLDVKDVRAADIRIAVDSTDFVTLSYDSTGSGRGSVELVDLGGSELVLDGRSAALIDGGTAVVEADIDAGVGRFTVRGTTTQLTRIGDGTLKLQSGASTLLDGGMDGRGGYVELSGGSSGGAITLSADDIAVLNPGGDLTVSDGGLLIEPSSGGPGGRFTVDLDQVVLTDDVASDSVVFHRTGGMRAISATGTLAIYRHDGVQLTGPDLDKLDISRSGYTLTRPSNNGALVCTIDDPVDVFYCDLDDDGLRDIRYQHTPSKELVLESGTSLRCDGPTSMTSCDVSGPATYASSVEVSGTMTCLSTMECRSSWTCDVDDDATVDVYCDDLAPGPRLVVASSAQLRCDGPASFTDCAISGTTTCNDLDCLGAASFAQPVQINSDLTVTGQLQVFGPKAFVQEHPEDPTKEVVYVALEGNEAGTYTRGSSQLKDGAAEINLPEDFRLVTNENGLTAQITPRGPVQSMLYVESITPTKLIVKASNKKDGSVKFDFMINGVRSGFENHQVIRDKKSLAMND